MEMNKDGPMWMTVKDMNEKLMGKSAKEQERLIKLQIRYRKKVMKDESVKKGLLNVSSGGKAFSVKQLKDNMRELLKREEEDEEVDEERAVDEDEPTTSKLARVSVNVDELMGRLLVHHTETEGVVKQSVCVMVKKHRGRYNV